MDECMQMNEGGQVTDDSELSMCLMWGLIDPQTQEEGMMSTLSIARYYRQWVTSAP
jgi:ADP-ribosylglycohydrolase